MASPEEQLFALALRGDMKSAAAALKRADNTRAGYAADWRDFTAWCGANGYESLPATEITVLLYVHWLITEGRKVSTAIRRLSAINSYHQAAGHNEPATSKAWQFLLALRRMRGEQPSQKRAIALVDLRAMCTALPENVRGIRDRAALTLGFASALRQSTLVGLDLADVELRAEGLVLTIRREKQDRKGQGRVLGVARGEHPETCPLRSVEAWLRVRGLSDGPLLTAVRGNHVQVKRLQPANIARIVKQAARRIGLDGEAFAGHSLRAGFVTVALENGVNEVIVMSHTGHSSLATLRKYFRRKDPFKGNASGLVGL